MREIAPVARGKPQEATKNPPCGGLRALERGEERVFSTSLYLRVHGRSPAELDRAQGRVEGALGGMMAGTRPALYEMLPGLLSCLPAGRDYLGRRRNLDTSSLATMLPFTSSHLGAGKSYACKVEALRALLLGGVLLLGGDVIAHNLLPVSVPVSVVMGAVGAPYFLFLFWRSGVRI